MLSKEEIAEEQRKEKAYNALFEKVIAKTGWGKFYPLMIGASRLLTKNLPKRLCIDKDGRPLVVYKGDVAKFVGIFAVPTHETISKDLSQGKYLTALGDLVGIGHIKEGIKQYSSKNTCYDISPDEVTEIHNKKIEEQKAKQAQHDAARAKLLANSKSSVEGASLKKMSKTKKVLIFSGCTLGILIITGLIINNSSKIKITQTLKIKHKF